MNKQKSFESSAFEGAIQGGQMQCPDRLNMLKDPVQPREPAANSTFAHFLASDYPAVQEPLARMTSLPSQEGGAHGSNMIESIKPPGSLYINHAFGLERHDDSHNTTAQPHAGVHQDIDCGALPNEAPVHDDAHLDSLLDIMDPLAADVRDQANVPTT